MPTKIISERAQKQRRQKQIDLSLQILEEQSLPRKKIKFSSEIQSQKSKNAYEAIEFIPQVYLTKQMMTEDPLKLLGGLQEKYINFGAVKLITPYCWKPSANLSINKFNNFNMPTRFQPLHLLTQGKAFVQNKSSQSFAQFLSFASEFERHYQFRFEVTGISKESRMEEQYWNLVNKKAQKYSQEKKYQVTVQYAADLPTSKFGSGFPLYSGNRSLDKHFDYGKNLFNLNNIYKSPTSILKMSQEKQEKIGGITVPWVYVGMQFSTFCWHVEDCQINSLNYSHKGSVKIWYVISGSQKSKFDQYFMKKNKRECLERMTYMIDPLQLKKNNIQVYKAYQKPGEYICTFLRAYHCGFSTGLNIGQAVNFLTLNGLDLVYKMELMNTKYRRDNIFDYDWIVYRNYFLKKKQFKDRYQKMLKNEQKILNRLVEQQNICQVEKFDDKLKFDKNVCRQCAKYNFLNFVKCQKCQNIFCVYDIAKCCESSYVLFMREPNNDRIELYQRLKTAVEKL